MKRLAAISVILGMALIIQGCAVYPSGGVAYTGYAPAYGSSYSYGTAYGYPANGYNSYGYYGGYWPSLSFSYYGAVTLIGLITITAIPPAIPTTGPAIMDGKAAMAGAEEALAAVTIGLVEASGTAVSIGAAEAALEVAAIIGAAEAGTAGTASL